jgi:acyl transferase domain-containing protein
VNGLNDSVTNGDSVRDRSRPRLLVWSAQDKDGLKRVKEGLAQYVEAKSTEWHQGSEETEAFMSELAYTLSDRRSLLQWKTYAITSSPEEFFAAEEGTALVAQSSRVPRLGFVFTGQGAQWPRMGAELMEYKVFHESVMAADRYLREECGCAWSAEEELQKGKSTSQLHLAEFSQSLCTVLQVALVDLLRTWNIRPTAVAGHSSGEIAAAYAMGALSKEDACKVAYYRGVLSSEMKINAPDLDGSMIAAGLSSKQAELWISKVTDGELVVACINSPSSVTISGDTTGIDQLLGMLNEEGVFARKLQVDTAYHSPHMQTVAQEYYELLEDIVTLEPSGDCIMHSSVIGSTIKASQLGAVNWVTNLTSPVRFSDAIYNMLRPLQGKARATDNAVDLLVEIGPHSALQGPATQTLKANGITNIPYQSVLIRNQHAVETAMNLAGALFAQGCPVNIQEVNSDGDKHFLKPLVDLPTYPWKHSQRFWHESRVEREYLSRDKPKLSLLGAPSPSVGEGERLWRGFIRLSEEPWIGDHKIQGAILYPAAGYLAMALEAASQTSDQARRIAAYKMRDIQLTSALVVSDEADLEYIVQLRPHNSGTRDASSTWTEFVVTSSPDGKGLVKNCSGLLIVEYEHEEGSSSSQERNLELQALKSQYLEARDSCKTRLDTTEFYADLTSMGLEYGPTFANMTDSRIRNGQSWGVVEIPDVLSRTLEGCDRPHIIHPGTLDAIFHLAFAAVKGGKDNPSTAMVPKSIDEVIISANVPFAAGIKLPGFSNSARHGFKDLKADIVMLDDNENLPIVEINGFLCTEVSGASSSNATENSAKSITSKLIWRPAIDLLSSEELRGALGKFIGLEKLTEVSFVPSLIFHYANHPPEDIWPSAKRLKRAFFGFVVFYLKNPHEKCLPNLEICSTNKLSFSKFFIIPIQPCPSWRSLWNRRTLLRLLFSSRGATLQVFQKLEMSSLPAVMRHQSQRCKKSPLANTKFRLRY